MTVGSNIRGHQLHVASVFESKSVLQNHAIDTTEQPVEDGAEDGNNLDPAPWSATARPASLRRPVGGMSKANCRETNNGAADRT